jgi:tetratricopeptide (TPR) repeat protein
MKKSILLTLICLSVFAGSVSAQDVGEAAKAKLKLAIDLMDQGFYAESLKLLDEAEALDPNNSYVYNYERAYLHYLQEDYKTGIRLLKKCLKHDNASDLVYQMLGNVYDKSGRSKKALSIYAEGRTKFPNSGKLYRETGVVYQMQGDYNTALQYHTKGIEVEPLYPSNWFDAANLTLNSDSKAFGMVYGETAICLEPNSTRAEAMRVRLWDAYNENITFPNDTTTVTDFSNNVITFPSNFDEPGVLDDFKVPFPIAYDMTLAIAVGEKQSIDVSWLIEARRRFIERWFTDDAKWYEAYPIPLFDFHRALIDAGHFEAYNQWLFSPINQTAFEMWSLDNEEAFVAFIEWFNQNSVIGQ